MQEVKRKSLLDALDKLKPGLSPKELILQMTHYNFLGKYIVTYNDLISVFHPFETQFVCSVKAETLNDLISRMTEEDIGLKLFEEENKTLGIKETFLKIKTETVEADFPVLLKGDLTKPMQNLEKEIEKGDWKDCPSDFVDGAYLCMFSASKDAMKGTLTCLNVEGQDLITCDDSRATWFTMDVPMESFLIKATVAKELRQYGVSQYKIGDSWVHFRNKDGIVFNVRRIEGVYKDMRKYFEPAGVDFILPQELMEAIDLVGVANLDESPLKRLVELSIEAQSAVCRAKKEGGVRIKKSVSIPFYNGEEFGFFVQPDFLKEIVERSPKDEKTGEKVTKMKLDYVKGLAYFLDKKFKSILTLRVQKDMKKQEADTP